MMTRLLIKLRPALNLLVAVTLVCTCLPAPLTGLAAPLTETTTSNIVFVGTPGISAPPATLGPYTMLPFPLDTRALYNAVTSVPGPIATMGSISFSNSVSHVRIGSGWSNWSHTYSGDLYDTGPGGDSLTITLPENVAAFYFYPESANWGDSYSFTSVSQDGTSSGAIITPHPPGAKYTGFYGVNGATIQSIQVTCAGGCDGFALGEFALAPTPVDLLISMSGPEQVFAGEELTYTIPVTNTSATPAYSVKVTFPLYSMSYLSANYTCNQSLDTLTCNLGDLPGGTRRDLTVNLRAGVNYVAEDPDASILVSNQVQTSCSNLDNNPDNNLSNFVDTLITEQADLEVSAYSIPDTSVRAGELLTYTIHTDNLGPSTARNVVVSDTLLSNPNFQIESCSFSTTQGYGTLAQPSCAGTFVTFPDGPDMSVFTTSQLQPPEPGASGRLIASFVLRALTDLDASNTTQAYADTPDPETPNNTITGSISVSAVADLSVTLTATVSSMPAGGQAGFQMEVTNHGPSKAENILLNDFIPTGLVSGTIQVSGLPAGSCTVGTPGDAADPLICQVGDLDKDGSIAFNIQGLIDPAYFDDQPVHTLANLVEVSSDTFDNEDLNNQTSATINVTEVSDLGLSLAFLGSTMAGETFQYQYSLTNAGPSEAREVTLLDNLPQETEFIDAQVDLADGAGKLTLLCTFDAPSALLTCPLGDLPVIEASGHITVTANLRLKPEANGTKTDDASLSSLTPLAEPIPPTAVDFTVTKQADLSLSESSNPQTAAQGDTVKFTLTVTNTGPSDATSVVISDTLPVGIDYDSSHLSTSFSAPTRVGERSKPSLIEGLRGAQPVCQLDSTNPDQITCSLGRLIPGEKRAIEIWGIVPSDTPPGTVLTNTAEVTSPITDLQMDDNRDSSSTSVDGVDLSLKDSAQGEVALDGVFAMPDQVSFNRTLTYSLNITNQGNLVAENVEVEDLLPAGTSLLSLSPSQGSCLPGTPGEATQPVICNLGDLAGGATANVVIQLHVLVDTPIGTSLYNQASVSSDASDGIRGNDSATNNTEVVGYKNTWFLPVMLCSQ